MAPKGVFVFRLGEKIGMIASTLHEAEVIESATMPKLAQFAGIVPKTLQSSIDSGRMTKDLQNKICLAARFDAQHPTWIDYKVEEAKRRLGDSSAKNHTYEGHDTPENFREMIRACWGLPCQRSLAVNDYPPEYSIRDLIRFTCSGTLQDSVPNELVQIFIEIVISSPIYVFDDVILNYGFNRVNINFQISDNNNIRAEQRLGAVEPAILGDGRISDEGTVHDPSWMLFRSDDRILEGRYTTTEAPLAGLSVPVRPSEFDAQIRVRPYDGSLRQKSGEQLLSHHKEVIIKMILNKALSKGNDGFGWIVIGNQTVSIDELSK